MQLDREATAARRQASRLAGLVRLPAAWPMAFRNPPARGKSDRHPLRRKRNPCKGCVCPTPTAGEQSGDRQRREKGPPILSAEKGEHERAPNVSDSYPTPLRATLRAPPSKWAIKAFFRRVSAASRGRGQPLRAVCPRNVVRLFRPLGRNWTTRIYSGRPTVRLPQTEAWAERERVPSGHNCRRQLATGRPEQIQEPGTAVPGTPIFANNAQRGGPPLESPCRWLSFAHFSFAIERKV